MMDMNKILVPYDFSKEADMALNFALELKTTLTSRVVVVHVSNSRTTKEFQEYFQQKSISNLDAFVIPLFENQSVDESIASFAIELGINFIITGTEGINELEDDRTESTSANLVALTHCPVLAIKRGQKVEIKNVVFCAEFLDSDDYHDFHLISDLVKFFNATVHFVFVEDNHEQKHTSSKIKNFAKLWKIDNYEVNIVEETAITSGIYQVINKTHPDLLVLGYHKSRSQEHDDYGSLSQDFINYTKHSVLAIHV